MSNTTNPESLPRYHDFHHDVDLALARDESDMKSNVHDRLINRIKKIGAISTAVVVTNFGYELDVSIVDRQLAETHASLTSVYKASSPEHQDTMVVVMAGLGNRSAYPTASALPTYDRMGDVEAVTYDNKGVDPESIAALVVQKATLEGKKSVILDGHSMGGLVAAAVAATIYGGDSGLKVKAVIADCTPGSPNDVRESQRTIGDVLSDMASAFKGSLESRPLRFVLEMAARHKKYININEMSLNLSATLQNTREIVHDKFLSPDAASGVLVDSQYGMIRNANIANNLRTLGKADNGKVPPIIFFQQPTNVANDTIVYDDRSREGLKKLTTENNLQFYVFYTDPVEGGHANPTEARDTYNKIAASIGLIVNGIPQMNPNVTTLAYPDSLLSHVPATVKAPR
ncbi:hypothetical protein H7171_03540 [Candidatus Saccharibacteria bacterium]|nr:hypothetical protein [Candidatus Saccharibacteria bacterium]